MRPLFHRISVAEMTVPYCDPAFLQYRKNAFDIGEYGIGVLANSLELGCDCLGEIYYFDASYINAFGELMPINNAICMHEEDAGILWKHYEFRTDKTEVRRSRKLVVSFIATVGNYEYAFYWNFFQDGTLQLEVKATGVVQTGALLDGEETKFGTMLMPNLYAPHHQHHFCVRMDTMIDGVENQVTEVDSVADPIGPDNPYGNAFYLKKTTFEREIEAARLVDPFKARYWVIQSSEHTNRMGYPTGFRIEPGETAPPLAVEGASLESAPGISGATFGSPDTRKMSAMPLVNFLINIRAATVFRNGFNRIDPSRDRNRRLVRLWAPPHSASRGLARDAGSALGFKLKPVNFFDRNPALDVPPSHAMHSHGSGDEPGCAC